MPDEPEPNEGCHPGRRHRKHRTAADDIAIAKWLLDIPPAEAGQHDGHGTEHDSKIRWQIREEGMFREGKERLVPEIRAYS